MVKKKNMDFIDYFLIVLGSFPFQRYHVFKPFTKIYSNTYSCKGEYVLVFVSNIIDKVSNCSLFWAKI
jgi:hypothetical protein